MCCLYFVPNLLVISTIKYPVFRWELCKGYVCESVKKTQVVCIQRSLTTRSRDWLAIGKSPKCHTCEACRKLKGHDSWSTTRQKIHSGQAVSSQLKLATRSTCETESPECPIMQKYDFSHFSCTHYKYAYIHEMLRVSRENFERETLEKTKID